MGESPASGTRAFASELKCLVDQGFQTISEIPAGCQYTPEGGVEKYYNPSWDCDSFEHNPDITPQEVRDSLERAVVKRMMTDVDYGVFLSGGVDSCIVATLMRPHVDASSGFRLPSITVSQNG
jgi:asparagine synthase (glutamine-hydrolysing)|eukprot:SAG25_NODE_1527_length_2837_cov_1.697224_4_plen_123_part_00